MSGPDGPSPVLSELDRHVLLALDEHGGSTSAMIVRAVREHVPAAASSKAIRRVLDLLGARSLAMPMDEQSPICWVRTPPGTRAILDGGIVDSAYPGAPGH